MSSRSPMWNGTRGDRHSTSDLQPPLPTHTGCYVSMLTSSPGLHAPINSQPYGFQLWLLADVCPTHRSIWHRGDLVSPFGNFGRFRSDFDYQASSGGLFFSPEVKLRHNVAVICTWKSSAVTHGSRRHCLSIKPLIKLDEHGSLYSCMTIMKWMMKFSHKLIKWIQF